MLEALTAEQFANLKSGVLTQLTEPPTNLADEADPFWVTGTVSAMTLVPGQNSSPL